MLSKSFPSRYYLIITHFTARRKWSSDIRVFLQYMGFFLPNPAKNLDYVGIYSPATVRPSLHTSDLNQGIDYSAYLSTSYFNLAPIAQRPFVRRLFCGQKILLLEPKTYILFQIPYFVGKKIFSSEYTFHILIIYSWKLEMSVSQGLELNATYDFGQ